MKNTNIGFIGFGNMARAMVTGLLAAGAAAPGEIYACAAHYGRLCQRAESLGIHPAETGAEVAAHCGLIVLAVKPEKIETVVTPIREQLVGKVVVSIAAGWNFHRYEGLFVPGTHHISTVPNTPVAANAGILACESTHSLTEGEFGAFQAQFGSLGLIELVDSRQLSIAGTIGGCTPAFTAMYLEALGDAGVKYGLSRECAYRMAAQMLVGTGALYLRQGGHPGTLKDAVCSPGGTTIRGVAALEKHNFRGSVLEAIDAIEGG